MNIASAEACQVACQDEDKCEFWTYNINTKECGFKNSDAEKGAIALSYATSGPKWCGM